MNKKIIIGGIIISLFFSFFIYKKYKAKESEYKELYVIQVGAYKSYDNVAVNTKNFDNYIVTEENGLYKILIGLSFSEEVYNKISTIYAPNISTYKKVLKITDKKFIENISTFDDLIKNTDNKEKLNLIIKEELRVLNDILNK